MAKKLTSDEIKARELSMLREFDRVAKENGLKYYLVGGTLLGAVRHHGFIPWDDDIDIGLARPEYNRLIKLNRKKKLFPENLQLVCPEDGTLRYPFMKLIDTKTHTLKTYETDIPHLWVDIFPVDGLPDDPKDVKKVFRKVDFLRRMMHIRNANWGAGKTLFHKLAKLVLIPIAHIIPQKKYESAITGTAKQTPYGSTGHCGIVTMARYGPNECMKLEEFEKTVKVTFEGEQYDCCSCWDSYLTNLYGDYMKLPPEDKRETHDMEVIVE